MERFETFEAGQVYRSLEGILLDISDAATSNPVPDTTNLFLFIAAGWLLNLTPGPDVLYIATHAARSGWRAGLLAGLGITLGCLVHVAAGALGVSALIATPAVAFTMLKWLGAAYLLWIGVRMLRSPADASPAIYNESVMARDHRHARQIFLGGFWTNVLNPKVALFFLAFLPQFIAPDSADKTLAFALLGLLFVLNSLPVTLGWVMFAAAIARGPGARRAMRWIDRTAGAMFVFFALRLALAERPD